jgi:hypothetical protein
MSAIANLWAKRIEMGEKTLDQVPAKLKESVIAKLIEDGFIISESASETGTDN